MNVRCPQCEAVYRVDPERVPPGGARARCARCGAVMQVTRDGAQAPRATAAQPASAPATPGPSASPSASASPAPPAPSASPVATPPPAASPAPSPVAPFGASDPHSRAKRLARALVSDIVAYHPARREASLKAGTLRTEFQEEIRKSWAEYVEQVGSELAKSTPYFRDALNEILANGQKIF
jgi:predicted Zn finger-like uncharacterized protein